MSWLSEVFGGGGGGGGGGSTKTTTKTTTQTNITDKRQVAEGEYVAGPDSIMALPYSVLLGEGASFSFTEAPTDTSEIVGNVLSNMGSTVGQLLGIQGQMAQGMFELSPKIIAEVKGFEASAKPQTERTMLYAIVGIAALLIFMRK